MGRPARAGGPAQRRSVRATAAEWALYEEEAVRRGMVNKDGEADISEFLRAGADFLASLRDVTVRVRAAGREPIDLIVDSWSAADALQKLAKHLGADAVVTSQK